LLGKKIQIRNEERTLKTTRLKTGKIDDRLIHSLGYGAEQVFERTFVDQFNPLYLHISIDASGSMSGLKWTQTMIATVAIAKAASMVSNLHVVISFRYSAVTKGSGARPVVLIAYDSTKDDIMKVKQLFPYLSCPSSTPEGLCFETLEDIIVSGTSSRESYFINFSDGEPYFSNESISYSGDAARKHTRKIVESMRLRGIKILSYFIGGSSDNMTNFKMMYGKDAEKIDVTALVPLAKTLNKLFTTK
jgi:nitric oxide reductase activation protein